MKQPDYPPGILWCASLIPDRYSRYLRLEMVDTTGLLDYEMREMVASKLGSIQEYKADRVHAGNPIHCSVDSHAMQDQPGVIILRGNLHDLEALAARFDNRPQQMHTPDAKTHARGGHLRLVASNGVAVV